eukprot:7118232-Prymnesium_polylepis.1
MLEIPPKCGVFGISLAGQDGLHGKGAIVQRGPQPLHQESAGRMTFLCIPDFLPCRIGSSMRNPGSVQVVVGGRRCCRERESQILGVELDGMSP